jgi:hypothetical protein
LHGTKTREELFLSVRGIMKGLELPWKNTEGDDNRRGSKYDWKEHRFDGYN